MKQKNSLNKKILKQQKQFIESLEGLGDILVFLTENKRNNEVIPTLNEFDGLLQSLLDLRETNSEKFNQLMLAEDYWKMLEKDKNEAQMRLGLSPEKYLVTFSFLLQQVIRVFDAALKVENEEVTRYATYQLEFFLAKVSEIKQMDLLVKEILNKLYELSRKSIASKSIAAHPSTYHWYTNIVFENLKQKDGFRYDEYLEIFNKYFLENIKFLINENEIKLFKNLVGHLVDGIHVPDYSIHKLWDYSDLLTNQSITTRRQVNEENNLNKLIGELVEGAKNLHSESRLKEWLTNFQKFKEIIYPLLNQANKRKANLIEKELTDAVTKLYANQTLVGIMFLASAWAIYRKQSSFIVELWSHKQPEDANASYSGNDIYPKDLIDAVSFYFQSSVDDIFGFFWDDHHDSEKYTQMYFLLLLLKYLKNIQPYVTYPGETNPNNGYPDIENFSLPFDSSQKLADIKYVAGKLIPVAEELKTSTLLNELNFAKNQEEVVEIIDKRLVPFLNRIIQNAEEKIQKVKTQHPLSETKINEFKQEVHDSFIESASIRKLLIDKNKYEDKTSERQIIELPLIGHDRLDQREMFIEDWHVNYVDSGKNFGRSLGEGEDDIIVKKILESLTVVQDSSIDQVLQSFQVSDDTVIFAAHDFIYDHLEGSGSFRPHWTETNAQREPHFHGWYIFNDRRIKVYSYRYQGVDSYYAVLNINAVGNLIQHYPLLNDEPEELLFHNLRIRIKDFATDAILLQTWLNNPRDWLPAKGSQEQQKQYLSQLIILQIGEKFEFVSDSNPQGVLYKE